VEDAAIQVVWRDLNPGLIRATARIVHGAATVAADCKRSAPFGGVVLDGLEPATSYDLELRLGDEVVYQDRFTTLSPPPGPPLYRLATLNDLHLGCAWFGPLGWMREELAPGQPPSSVRCAHAALADALDWGAERVVMRGDLVHTGDASEWAALATLVDEAGVPVDLSLGNHETRIRPWRVDLATGLSTLGVELDKPVRTIGLPGTDLVLTDTAVSGHDDGAIDHVADELIAAAARAGQPVTLMTHHNFERRRDAFSLPRGVSPRESRSFLDRLAAVAPASLVSSGHTHRHRRRMHLTVPVVEVGSPKDYPGVWSGYVVHEGGVRQVVRRITDPDCMVWTERTRRSMGGIWGWWSSGSISDRCFTHAWPSRGYLIPTTS